MEWKTFEDLDVYKMVYECQPKRSPFHVSVGLIAVLVWVMRGKIPSMFNP